MIRDGTSRRIFFDHSPATAPFCSDKYFACYFRVLPVQNLNPDVLMMEHAEDWYSCDAAGLLSPSKMWSIFIQ